MSLTYNELRGLVDKLNDEVKVLSDQKDDFEKLLDVAIHVIERNELLEELREEAEAERIEVEIGS